MIILHNDRFTSDDAVVAPNDRGLMLGDGVFDTMLAVDGQPVYAREHMGRLARHAAVLRIPLPFDAGKLEQFARELLQKNNFNSGRHAVRTTLTRGPGPRGLALPDAPQPTLIMQAGPAPDIETLPPVRAVIARTVRRNEHSPLSQIKSLNYGDNMLALMEAKDSGATEAIMLNGAGNATCASTSNIFVLTQEGTVITPPLTDGAMDGVTRHMIVQKGGVKEISVSEKDLLSAAGIYLSNSIIGIRPIASLDGRELNTPLFPEILT